MLILVHTVRKLSKQPYVLVYICLKNNLEFSGNYKNIVLIYLKKVSVDTLGLIKGSPSLTNLFVKKLAIKRLNF